MAYTFNTGNPVGPNGSADARDLVDNAQVADRLINGSELTALDRLGVARKTWSGIEQDFQQFLINSGYQFLGDYAAGIDVTAYNQVIRDGGEFWRVAAGTSLPYTTTGAGMPEGGAFVSVGDAVLRQDLANPDNGAAMVGFGQSTVADALPTFHVLRFGADRTGVTDSTDAINAAAQAAHGAGGGVVYIPSGTYLLGKLTPVIYSTDDAVIGSNNIWALIFARSNVTFRGDGASTVLKAAGGLVATNAAHVGTKGYQIFVHEDYQTAVDNFAVEDMLIDFNGLNNLMEPLNAYSQQSQVHGVYIEKGRDCRVERVIWKNHPGHQIVNFSYNTVGCIVRNCQFDNNGWLGGVNALLTDHSTIYCAGRDYLVEGNRFTQPDIVPVGAAYELHGIGIARDNYSDNYAAISNVASTFGAEKNANIMLINNISRNTGGGIGVYRLGSDRTLRVRLQGNDYQLNGKPATNFPLVGPFKQMINTGNVNADGVAPIIESFGNKYSVAAPEWVTPGPDDLLSVAFMTHGASGFFKSDVFSGFVGPVVEVQRCITGQVVVFESCKFSSCGRGRDFVTNNALVNYTNSGANDHGVRLYALSFDNCTIDEGCAYAAYLSVQQLVAGSAMAPAKFLIQGDTVDGWLPPTVGLGNILAGSVFKFNYECLGPIDLARPLPVGTEVATSSSGRIGLDNAGWRAEFTTNLAVSAWSYASDWYDGTPPTTPRPFGDRIGDRLNVLSVGGGNSPIQYICTQTGSGGGLGTWVPVLLN